MAGKNCREKDRNSKLTVISKGGLGQETEGWVEDVRCDEVHALHRVKGI